LPPLNHSDADKVGFQITLVGGKRSSWNNSLWLKQVNISVLSCKGSHTYVLIVHNTYFYTWYGET